MYKSVLAMSLVGVLIGCAANRQHHIHEDYGIGNNDNPNFVKDRDDCKKSVYVDGVVSEGKRITEPTEIESLENEYNDWLADSLIEAYKRGSGSYAHAGASAAVAVTSGNTSGLSSQPVKLAPLPEKYKDLDRLRSETLSCLSGKGWMKK